MKKIMKRFLVGTLLISILTLVIAFPLINKDINVSDEDYDLLKKVNSLEFEVSEISCNLDECDEVTIKSGFADTSYLPEPYWSNCSEYFFNESFNLKTEKCLTWVKIYYTNEELDMERDAEVEDVKQRVLRRLKTNKEKEEQENKTERESKIKYIVKKEIPLQ